MWCFVVWLVVRPLVRLVLSAGQTAPGVRLLRDIVAEQFSSKMVQTMVSAPRRDLFLGLLFWIYLQECAGSFTGRLDHPGLPLRFHLAPWASSCEPGYIVET